MVCVLSWWYHLDPQLSTRYYAGRWWFHNSMAWIEATGLPKHIINQWHLYCMAWWSTPCTPTMMAYSSKIRCTVTLGLLLKIVFWRLLINGVATTFDYEPSWTFMWHGSKILYLQISSPTTCRIDTTQSWYISLSDWILYTNTRYYAQFLWLLACQYNGSHTEYVILTKM